MGRRLLRAARRVNPGLKSQTSGTQSSGQTAGGLEISFKADPSLYDGRYANVGWLQELPKQITNLSWDNAALMSLDHDGQHGARAERCGGDQR